jgi:sulfur-oxidizing protein SoxY
MHTRRNFLKGTLALSLGGIALGSGLIKPSKAEAAEWPKAGFESKSIDDALKNVFGASATTASGAIKVKAPEVAENGAQVNVSMQADMPNVESMAILVEKNAAPLAAFMSLSGADAFFATSIKMAQTSDVHFVVKAGGKLYSVKKTVKVTAGGCGG